MGEIAARVDDDAVGGKDHLSVGRFSWTHWQGLPAVSAAPIRLCALLSQIALLGSWSVAYPSVLQGQSLPTVSLAAVLMNSGHDSLFATCHH